MKTKPKEKLDDIYVPTIEVSAKAEEFLGELPEGVQVAISEGLVRAFGKITTFLVVATSQTFLSREQSFQLNYLTNQYQTVVANGYPLKVRICSKTFSWEVLEIGEPSKLEGFNVVSLV